MHLMLKLKNELQAFDVRFVTLKGVVERIVPRKLNKGLLVKKVLRDNSALMEKTWTLSCAWETTFRMRKCSRYMHG